MLSNFKFCITVAFIAPRKHTRRRWRKGKRRSGVAAWRSSTQTQTRLGQAPNKEGKTADKARTRRNQEDNRRTQVRKGKDRLSRLSSLLSLLSSLFSLLSRADFAGTPNNFVSPSFIGFLIGTQITH